MLKDIAIYGAGGFGREVACLIRLINEQSPQWNLIGFFDDVKAVGTENEYGKVLGGIDALNAWEKPLDIAIAIGSPQTVHLISSKINNSLVDFPNLISPDTKFLDKDNIALGKGNIIAVSCSFSCAVKIGDFNSFNSHINVGHDAEIGNYNALMPGVKISGGVRIGEENFLGVDSVVLQYLTIGRNTVIGANSVVIRKTKDNNTYVGNPAKLIKY